MQIYHKESLRAGGSSHRSRTFGKSRDVMVSQSRLDDDSRHFYDGMSSTILPETYLQGLIRRTIFSLLRLLVRPWSDRVAQAAGGSFGAHICPIPCSLCHLIYTHTLMDLQQNVATLPAPTNCKYSRSRWANGIGEPIPLFEHFFLFPVPNVQTGWERLESTRFR